MPTRSQLLKLADEAASSAAEHGRLREMMLEQERQLRAMAEQLSTNTQANRSMFGSKMDLQNAGANKRVRIAATMTAGATEAKRALLEAGLTPQDVAKARGVGRSTVDAWCRGTRSIPSADRDWLKSKHGIPTRVWKKQA